MLQLSYIQVASRPFVYYIQLVVEVQYSLGSSTGLSRVSPNKVEVPKSFFFFFVPKSFFLDRQLLATSTSLHQQIFLQNCNLFPSIGLLVDSLLTCPGPRDFVYISWFLDSSFSCQFFWCFYRKYVYIFLPYLCVCTTVFCIYAWYELKYSYFYVILCSLYSLD